MFDAATYKEKIVFLDENNKELNNICFLDVGDKIINANGEWTCIGFTNNIVHEIQTSIIDKILGRKPKTNGLGKYHFAYIMRRTKKNNN
jgi:hypothetical protein